MCPLQFSMSNENPLAPSSPPEVRFPVAEYLGGRRIDAVVGRELRNHTRFRIHRLVRAGAVLIDGQVADIRQRVYPGQQIRVRLLEPPDKLLRATPSSLEVIYEDRWLVAVNKPAGMIIHPAEVDRADTLVNALQWHLDQTAVAAGLLRPGIVHRLDRDTSGVVVATKDHLSHRRLSIGFQERTIRKTYLAMVEGHPAEDDGTIDTPLGQVTDPESHLVSAADDAINPRPAQTDYSVLEKFDGWSVIEARPLTGRLHQIRVHLASIGHPLLGDPFYGPRGEIRRDRSGTLLIEPPAAPPWPAIDRQALHARSLSFEHPITGRPLTIESPLAEDLSRLLSDARR